MTYAHLGPNVVQEIAKNRGTKTKQENVEITAFFVFLEFARSCECSPETLTRPQNGGEYLVWYRCHRGGPGKPSAVIDKTNQSACR